MVGEKGTDVGGEEESMVLGVVIMCFRPLQCRRVVGEEWRTYGRKEGGGWEGGMGI